MAPSRRWLCTPKGTAILWPSVHSHDPWETESLTYHEAVVHVRRRPQVSDDDDDDVDARHRRLVERMRNSGVAVQCRTATRLPHMFAREFQTQYLERHFASYASIFCSIWESLGGK